MENIDDLIKECVYNTPFILLPMIVKDKSLIKTIDSYLPYSTGFEIECAQGENFNTRNFTDIPNIVSVNIDGWEQRFRIPSGINGLICLYHISMQLKYNSTLNEGSGIHYHVDMSDCYDKIDNSFIDRNSSWMLKELDTWGYEGTYNPRKCSRSRTWVRYSDKNTAEFRIGEMTFDYEVLVNRIIHANDIVKRLKGKLGVITPKPSTNIITVSELLTYNSSIGKVDTEETEKLRQVLSSLEEVEEEKIDLNDPKEVIKNRIVRL